MIFKILAVIFLVSVVSYNSVDAIKCYQCDSTVDPNCNTPFDSGRAKNYLVTCSSLYGCCARDFTNFQAVSTKRYCASYCGQPNLLETNGSYIVRQLTICGSDGCNSAPSMLPKFTVISFLFSSMLLYICH